MDKKKNEPATELTIRKLKKVDIDDLKNVVGGLCVDEPTRRTKIRR